MRCLADFGDKDKAEKGSNYSSKNPKQASKIMLSKSISAKIANNDLRVG